MMYRDPETGPNLPTIMLAIDGLVGERDNSAPTTPVGPATFEMTERNLALATTYVTEKRQWANLAAEMSTLKSEIHPDALVSISNFLQGLSMENNIPQQGNSLDAAAHGSTAMYPLPAKLRLLSMNCGEFHWSEVMANSLKNIEVVRQDRWLHKESQDAQRGALDNNGSRRASSVSSSITCSLCKDLAYGVTIVGCNQSICMACALYLHIKGTIPMCPMCNSHKSDEYVRYVPTIQHSEGGATG